MTTSTTLRHAVSAMNEPVEFCGCSLHAFCTVLLGLVLPEGCVIVTLVAAHIASKPGT